MHKPSARIVSHSRSSRNRVAVLAAQRAVFEGVTLLLGALASVFVVLSLYCAAPIAWRDAVLPSFAYLDQPAADARARPALP
jgi:hypothetical protein